jgi:hypothetical protein
MADFTSMILRFRDLSTPPGTTLAEHQKIIASKGSVWWGWWNKQGETVPENAFRAILKSIEENGPFDVFLFDTGQNQLHRAKLAQIEWDKQLSLISTPDSTATPEYYGKSQYFAWFRLAAIESISLSESELNKWSYVQIDELFKTKKSVFETFYNKQISSFAELRSQDRTIWFIRPRQSTDALHEVRVYDSKVAPKNYSEEVVRAHSNMLLWVSDPHFSVDNHDFPRDPDQSRRNLSEAIRRDLAGQGITSIGGLLVSGDLTWRSAPDEFEWATKFINDIKSWSTLTPSHIMVCPGNHDLAFSSEPWTNGTVAAVVGETSSAAYKSFYSNLFSVTPTASMSSGRHFWLPEGQMVDVVSLNSSLLQQLPGAFQGQGFLGDPQLVEAVEGMKWSRDRSRPRAYRVCMIHHHVVPIVHREHPRYGYAASVVHDAGALIRWLAENEIDLVLHGHMHLPSLVKHATPLDYRQLDVWHEFTIAALGSSGVTVNHRPNVPNSYGLIKFERSGVRITVRAISADDAISAAQREVYSILLPYRTHA